MRADKKETGNALREGGGCGLLSAKGGLMMGTKKVGVLSSPPKKTICIIPENIKK